MDSPIRQSIKLATSQGMLEKKLITSGQRKRHTYSLQLHTYTYIHNWQLQPSQVRITAQLLTPLTLCGLILCVSGGTYSFTSTRERQIFEKLFHGNFIYSYGDFFSGKKMSPCYKVHKKIADQPCYSVIFYMRRTQHKY